MRKSDMVTHVGYTVGGNAKKGTFGTKVRFSTSKDNTLRVKELYKMGATEVWFTSLPNPMSREDAVRYLQNVKDKKVSNTDVKEAISYALKRVSSN